MVLGGRAQHRRSADVDVLDGVLEGDVRFCDGHLKRIQIDGDQIDRRDTVLSQGGQMRGQVAPGEQASVNPRMQRLDATVEQLGEPGHRLHGQRRHPRVLERGRRSAGRDDLPAEVYQPLRERPDRPLVADRDQRARHESDVARGMGRPASAAASTTAGSIRCSAASTRPASVSAVSPGSTGTRSCARSSPRS